MCVYMYTYIHNTYMCFFFHFFRSETIAEAAAAALAKLSFRPKIDSISAKRICIYIIYVYKHDIHIYIHVYSSQLSFCFDF